MGEKEIKELLGEMLIANWQLKQTVLQLTDEIQKLKKENEINKTNSSSPI